MRILVVVAFLAGCPGTEYLIAEREAPAVDEGAPLDDDEATSALWQLIDRPWDDGAGNLTPARAAQIYVPLQTDADCAVWPPIGESLMIVVSLPPDDADRAGAYPYCNEENKGVDWFQERCFSASRVSGATGADVAVDGDTLEVTSFDELGVVAGALHASSFPATTFDAARCR